MQFFNEAQRNLHPQIGLISRPIWSEVFKDSSIPDFIIPWMSMPSQELIKQLPHLRKEDKNKAWVAIACSHPTMDNQQLIEAGKNLGLNPTEMFDLAVMLGDSSNHLELLTIFSKQESSDNILKRYEPRINRATECGHINALNFCIHAVVSQATYKTIIPSFQLAAANGHLNILGYLENLAPKYLQDLIAADNFKAFSMAVANGHLNVLNYLQNKSPDKLQEMIDADEYKSFRQAAGGGHLDVLKFLEEKACHKFQDMITVYNYDAYQSAAENGRIEVLKYFEEKAPNKLQEMIDACDEDVVARVARDGYIDVLKYLEEKAPNNVQDIIDQNYHCIFQASTSNHQDAITQYLLNYPKVFNYAEAHQYEYERYVSPFVAQKMIALRAQQQQTEENNLDGVFDITSLSERTLLFLLTRNLIRRNDENLIDDLRFLLNIPSIKAMAHTAVTSHQPNELLRLALSVGNREAATVLLNLPHVRRRAEQDNFYRWEQQGRLDLSALAADQESSMTALTQGEQQQLQAVIDRYQPLLDQAGILHIMSELRQTLVKHYETYPANIAIQKEEQQNIITLPMEWNDFENFVLNSEQKEQALKAYYQNKAHTAWRYLSKPNPWMNEHASYVYINEEHNERWSTFEEYQSLICLFYLAAIDTNTLCIDDYSFATRLEHFIDELAHIGRAHNWDKTRRKENHQDEQYDDLEADRPSCYSGVKRRLFQSVLGHPLLKLVTSDLIKVEIKEFLTHQFKQAIHQNNRLAIKEAWDKGIDGDELSDKDIALIQSLNINEEQQQNFKKYLCDKYGSTFATNLSLKHLVDEAFELTSTTTSHLFKHGGLMVDFFEKIVPANQTTQSPYGFFAARTESPQNPEDPSSSLTPKRQV